MTPSRARPRRGLPRHLAVFSGGGLIAVALSGCVIQQGPGGVSQRDAIGPITFAKVLCASQSGTCSAAGNAGVGAGEGNNTLQLLAGFRVPAGATPPPSLGVVFTLRSSPVFPFGPVPVLTPPVLTPSDSYTAELQRLAPAAGGMKWVGYISNDLVYRKNVDPESGVLVGEFGIAPNPAGGPVRSFPNQFVVGSRFVGAGAPGTRAVSCGTSLTSLNNATGDNGQTICVDSPSPAELATDVATPTRDLAVTAGAAETARRGETAAVPFTLTLAGGAAPEASFAAPEASFALSAATTLPGATPSVTPGALAPASESTTPVTARVPVPVGAAPGSYQVTLRASVGGQVRQATGTLTVAALPAVTGGGGVGGGGGPAGGRTAGGGTAGVALSRLTIAPRSITNRRRGSRSTVSVTLSDPGRLRLLVERPTQGRRKSGRCVAPTRSLIRTGASRCTRYAKVATLTRAGLDAGRQSVTFNGRGRAPGTYRLSLTLVSGPGESTPLRGTVTVRG